MCGENILSMFLKLGKSMSSRCFIHFTNEGMAQYVEYIELSSSVGCAMRCGFCASSDIKNICTLTAQKIFDNFFKAVYWATVSLTTMGYGDIYPATTIGRIVTMVSSFVGIAIAALPAGIITAGYMDRIQKEK